MNSLQYNGNTYYLNGSKPDDEQYVKFFKLRRPVEDSDYFLAQRKAFYFAPAKLSGGYDDLSWLASFFGQITQPSEQEVRRAMIMTKTVNTGDGPMERYSLKAGGGSVSDSIFSSSLSVVVAHPQTGEDTWIVLLKKYSTTFSDVLITYKEIQDLFEQCSSPKQKSGRDQLYARDAIGFLLGCFRQNKIHFSGQAPKPLTSETLKYFILTVRPKAMDEYWESAFEYFDSDIRSRQQMEFEENQAKTVNADHQLRCLKDLGYLKQLRRAFFKTTTPVEASQQLELV